MAALPPAPGARASAWCSTSAAGTAALAAGCDEANVVVCATDGFGIRNQGAPVTEQMATMAAIAERRAGRGRAADLRDHLGGVRLPVRRRGERGRRSPPSRREAGALGIGEIALGDTIGVADPWTVRRRIEAVRKAAPDARAAHALPRHPQHRPRQRLRRASRRASRCSTPAAAASAAARSRPTPPATSPPRTWSTCWSAPASTPATTSIALIETGRWIGEKIGKPVPSALTRAGVFPPS